MRKEAREAYKPKITIKPELQPNNRSILKGISSKVKDREEEVNQSILEGDLPVLPDGYSIKPSLQALGKISVF